MRRPNPLLNVTGKLFSMESARHYVTCLNTHKCLVMMELSENPNLGYSSPLLNVTKKLLFGIWSVLVHSWIELSEELNLINSSLLSNETTKLLSGHSASHTVAQWILQTGGTQRSAAMMQIGCLQGLRSGFKGTQFPWFVVGTSL